MKEKKPQENTESEESEEFEEIDVKVCDICGDAGQEELLATCTRCIDGAEHTYCMRKRLRELPKGDWLCEECKMKEESETADKPSSAVGVKEVSNLKEITSKRTADKPSSGVGEKEVSNLKERTSKRKLVKESDSKAGKPLPHKVEKVGKERKNKEESENADKPQKLPGEKGLNLKERTSDPKLLQESDRKESEPVNTEKQVDMKANANSSKVSDIGAAISKAKSVLSRGSSFSYLEAGKQRQAKPGTSFGGSLSKSVSFNTASVQPKVKQLETVPQKQISNRELVIGDTRKDGVKSIIESASFKSLSSGSFSASKRDDHKVVKQEQKNMYDKGISNQQLGARDYGSRLNPEAISRSNPNLPQTNKRSLDPNIPGSEAKRSSSMKSFGGMSSTVRNSSIPSTHLQKPAAGIKDLTFSNIPKKEALGSGRMLHCKKCNEVGHSTQSCSIVKVHDDTLKPSTDRNPKEDVSSPRFPVHKNIRAPNQSTKSSKYNAEMACDPPPKNLPFSSSGFPNILRTSIADAKRAAADSNATSSRRNDLYSSGDLSQIEMKSFPQPLPNKASFLSIPSRPLVFPELESIWQGGFEVSRSGSPYKFFDGVQAHLSSSASPKVLEAATKCPCKLQLEEVARVDSWPLQFQGKGPQENNIGLFFFAKDPESYKKNYSELLEYMIKNDLALKGNIQGAELLVFPSNKLPGSCQLWNRLYFLWGVFIRKTSCSATPSAQDSQVPISQKIYPCEDPCDGAPVSGVQTDDRQLSNEETTSDNFLKKSDEVIGTNTEPTVHDTDDRRQHKKLKIDLNSQEDCEVEEISFFPMGIDLNDTKSETVVDDDGDASLSLSLSFSASKKE